MSTPSPVTQLTEQAIQNLSFDKDFNVFSFEMLGYYPGGNSLVRLQVDANGKLAVAVGGFTSGSVIFANTDGTLTEKQTADDQITWGLAYTGTDDDGLVVHKTGSSTKSIVRGIHVISSHTGNNGTSAAASNALTAFSHVSGSDSFSAGHSVAVEGYAYYDGSSTLGSMYALNGYLFNTSSGTVTNAYGLNLNFAGLSGGIQTNVYGIMIGDLAAFGATSAYSIYSGNGKARFNARLDATQLAAGAEAESLPSGSVILASTARVAGIGQMTLRATDAYTSQFGAQFVLQGKYNSAGDYATYAMVAGGKTNATDGDYTGYLSLYYQNGTTLTEGGRLTGAGLLGIGGTAPASRLQVTGGFAAASWTTTGIQFSTGGGTHTDNTSAAAATVATRVGSSIGAVTLASTNAITVTDAASFYVSGPPAQGSNTTITNALAMLVNGRSRITHALNGAVPVLSLMHTAGGASSYLGLKLVVANTDPTISPNGSFPRPYGSWTGVGNNVQTTYTLDSLTVHGHHVEMNHSADSGTLLKAYSTVITGVSHHATGLDVSIASGNAVRTNYGVNVSSVTGGATNYGGHFGVTGSATNNYGLAVDQPASGTHNSALVIGTVATATGSWALYSASASDSYFNGKVGFGTAAPTNSISLLGTSAQVAWMERHTTANTAGNSLTVQAGGATSAATDKAGGQLILSPGANTGTGRSTATIKQYTVATGTGTGDGTQVDGLVIGPFKALANNTNTALVNLTAASNTSPGGSLRYHVEVFDGTDVQSEEGYVTFGLTNKGGAFANNTTTKFGNQQRVTAGTLTVTWTITTANPAVVTVNANSSLTPSAGYPRVRYQLANLSEQAVAVQ